MFSLPKNSTKTYSLQICSFKKSEVKASKEPWTTKVPPKICPMQKMDPTPHPHPSSLAPLSPLCTLKWKQETMEINKQLETRVPIRTKQLSTVMALLLWVLVVFGQSRKAGANSLLRKVIFFCVVSALQLYL